MLKSIYNKYYMVVSKEVVAVGYVADVWNGMVKLINSRLVYYLEIESDEWPDNEICSWGDSWAHFASTGVDTPEKCILGPYTERLTIINNIIAMFPCSTRAQETFASVPYPPSSEAIKRACKK